MMINTNILAERKVSIDIELLHGRKWSNSHRISVIRKCDFFSRNLTSFEKLFINFNMYNKTKNFGKS